MTYIKDYTTTYEINGHEYTITAPARFDSATNEVVMDKKLDDTAAGMARAKYRQDLGLISPDKLKDYRKRTGFSQRNLAELTGLSPNSIALYESGEFPTTANNRILKSLISNDEVLRQYLKDNFAEYSKALLTKIHAYLDGTKISKVYEHQDPKFSVVQLANWLRSDNYLTRENHPELDPLTTVRLENLLYLAYGRYLVKTHNQLFDAKITHQENGPAIPALVKELGDQTVLDMTQPDDQVMEDGNSVYADLDISKLLKQVSDDYVDYSTTRLAKLTKQAGSPWSLTKEHHVIADEKILETFENGKEE